MAKKINTNPKPSARVKSKAEAVSAPAPAKSRVTPTTLPEAAASNPIANLAANQALNQAPNRSTNSTIAQAETKPKKRASSRKAAVVRVPESIIGVVNETVPAVTITAEPAAEPTSFTITHDDIARLAFSYWEARGRQGGSQQSDWARAERELRSLLG